MLYGREREQAEIDGLLDHVRSHRSRVLALTGPLGTGKTVLLAYAAERAPDMTVLRVRGLEAESELAFAGMHALLRPILGDLDQLPAVQRAALEAAFGVADGARPERFLVSLGALSLLSRAAERRPLLCLIDDAHWLDDTSRNALMFVARRLEAEGIGMIFAARDDELAEFDDRGLPRLRLGRLDRQAAEAILRRAVRGAIAPHIVDRLYQGAGGNPLGLVQIAAALTPQQLAGRDPLPTPLPVTKDLERLCLMRVRGLEPPAQAALLVAAADDSRRVAILADAVRQLGLPEKALETVERAGVIVVAGDQFEMAHPLIRSAVYHGATSGERAAAHRALAAAVAANGDPDRRAWHLAAAALGPDADVAAELVKTADRARARGAYSASASALERAVRLLPDPVEAGRLSVRAAEDAWQGGDIARAAGLLEAAQTHSLDAISRARVAVFRSLIEIQRGVPATAYDILVTAAKEAEASAPEFVAPLLLGARDAAGLSGHPEQLAVLGRWAARVKSSSDGERWALEMIVGVGALAEGRYVDAARILRGVLERAEDVPHVAVTHFNHAGTASLYLGDTEMAASFFRRTVAGARATAALAVLAYGLQLISAAECWNGNLAAASADAAEGLRLSREAGYEHAEVYLLATLASVAAVRGSDEECQARAPEVIRLARARGVVHPLLIAEHALAVLDLASGRAVAACDRLRDIVAMRPGVAHPFFALQFTPDFVEAAVHAGRKADALEPLERFTAWAEACRTPWPLAMLERSRALLAEGSARERHLEAALEHLSRIERPLDEARTRLLYGELLRRERHRVAAREHLRAAVETFERLDAARWAERARTELRASGQTARPRDPSTLDRLTPQELQVARFVAQGLSNPEVAAQLFLSRRTVDFHLRNVFAKLGISSRMELARFPLQPVESLAA